MTDEQNRAARLGRLLEVQGRKRQLEEWRLAELKREAIALAETSAEILKSLGDQSLLHGLFLDAKASTLRRTEGQAVRNRAAQADAEIRLRDTQGIEKRLERATRDAAEGAARAGEQDALRVVLDDYLTARRASFE